VEPEDAPPDMQSSAWWLDEAETARRRLWMPEKKDWAWVCLAVLPRIGMWTGQVSFDRTVAWLGGFECGQGGSITSRMRTRCEERLGRPTPLGWEVHIKADALGLGVDDVPHDAEMTDDEHRRTIAALRAALMDALDIDEPSDGGPPT